jgi:hypothetical protein
VEEMAKSAELDLSKVWAKADQKLTETVNGLLTEEQKAKLPTPSPQDKQKK